MKVKCPKCGEIYDIKYCKKFPISRMIRINILGSLSQNPKRFTDLLNSTNCSKATLSRHLKSLMKEEKIKKVLKNGNILYSLKVT